MYKLFFKTKKYTRVSSGYITLTAVVIIMAVMIFVVRGISLQTIDETNNTLSAVQYLKAKNLADACAEYALMQLSNDPDYNTTGTINDDLSGDSCEVVDISDTSGAKTIQAQSSLGESGYTYLLEVEASTTTATTTPSVVVESWLEVDEHN
jgi:hypothetical protein